MISGIPCDSISVLHIGYGHAFNSKYHNHNACNIAEIILLSINIPGKNDEEMKI